MGAGGADRASSRLNRKSHHRRRLIDAVVAVAARDGYGGLTVAKAIECAGSSRATFYEHFADKDECFLAAYRQIVAHYWMTLRDRLSSAPPEKRLERLLETLATEAQRDPAASRVLFVEVFGAPHPIRDEHEELVAAAERLVESLLSAPAGGAPPLQISAAALIGGIGGVISAGLLRGDLSSLGVTLADSPAWVEAHAIPDRAARLSAAAWARLGEGLRGSGRQRDLPPGATAGRLPRGRGRLERDLLHAEHRNRIVHATARAVAEKGYDGATVADIVTTAGITRAAFYKQFAAKEEAVIAVQTLGLQESLGVAGSAFSLELPWPERVWASTRAMLEYVSTRPDFAAVDLIETFAAGPRTLRRSLDDRQAFTVFLEEGYRIGPAARRLPPVCSEAIAGAIFHLLRRQAVAGETSRALSLQPEIAYLATAPFIGPDAALELVATETAVRTGGEK